MTHPLTDVELEELLRWAQRGRGWAFREYPPQYATLAGGCELIVLVPTLWRGRPPGIHARGQCERIEFPRKLAK